MRFRPLANLLLLLTITVFAALALGQTSAVYVESNRAEHNSILAYRNNGGTLSFLGEFPTGGKGVFDLSLKLGPFDSDQDVLTNSEGTVLYAVNSGSDSIAAFRIAANGSLSAITGSPFSSGGANPVSVGIARDTLAVVNKAMDPSRPGLNQPNYTSFSLAPDGAIENGPLSTNLAPVGSSPSQADISSGKRLVFDAQFLGGHLQSFLRRTSAAGIVDAPNSADSLRGAHVHEPVGSLHVRRNRPSDLRSQCSEFRRSNLLDQEQ